MRKILLVLSLLLGAAGGLRAESPLPFFVNFSDLQYGEFTPSASDRQFDYNETTGLYEITVDYDIDSPDRFMRFYQKDGDGIIKWGPLVRTHVSMLDNKEYPVYVEEDRTSPLLITGFYGEVRTAQVQISTVPGDTIMILRQVIEKEYIPENIYIWGSDDGGFGTRLFGSLTPSADDPYLFEGEMEMPTWHFDPKSPLADYASNSFIFFLSTNGNSSKEGIIFRSYIPYDTGDPTFSTIYLTNGQTFTTTLQTAIQESGALACHTPGKMKLSFNYKTYEFKATMLDAMNYATVTFGGIPTALHNNYLNVLVNGDDYPLFINPQKLWYSGDLELSVIPREGYSVEMECLTPNASCTITETEGTFSAVSAENGLQFAITLLEGTSIVSDINAASEGPIRVYTTGGILLLETDDPADLSRLPKGIPVIIAK